MRNMKQSMWLLVLPAAMGTRGQGKGIIAPVLLNVAGLAATVQILLTQITLLATY